MLRPLLFLTAICGTISSTSTGTASEEPLGPTNEGSTRIDDVDTNTAIVTEVIDDIQKATSTGHSYPELIDNEDHRDEVKYATHFPDDIADVITVKSTTETDVDPTTSHTKQILKPVKKSPTSEHVLNTTLPDPLTEVRQFVTEYTQNTTHILQTLRTHRTESPQKEEINHNSSSSNTRKQNVTLHNVTTEFVRIPNSSLASITRLHIDSSTSLINGSKFGVDPSDKSSSLLKDTTSPTSLPTTLGSEPTTALDDSRENTSPRPSIRVEDTLEASRIDISLDRALQRRRNINHAALWITIGFVVVLVSYIAVLVFYNRRRSDWQPSSQEYQRFEEDAPEVSTATTGCSTSEDDNVSNHSTDVMTQTHPFLDTIGEADREITGYYSDSEQLYRQ